MATRKRGVKASRSKLEIAMLAAGFKTQAALAEQIATDENLENAPKDTVNRVFRQENVSPNTIARLAKALNVEPYTLYLSKSEQDQENAQANPIETFSQHETVVPKKTTRWLLTSALLIVVASAITVSVTLWNSTKPNINSELALPAADSNINKPVLGRYSLVIHSSSAETDEFASALQQKVAVDFRSAIINRSLLTNHPMSLEISREFQSDGVVTIKSQPLGRYLAIQVFLYLQNEEYLIWTASVAEIELSQQKNELAVQLHTYLQHLIEFGSENKKSFVDIIPQEQYLKARVLMDHQQSELNIKRAQGLLTAAIEAQPDFAKAHGAMCETLIYESWMGDEKTILEAAHAACERAQNLSPEDPYINSTYAYLYRRTGRIQESISHYYETLQQWPNNIDAVSGLASAYLEASRHDMPEFPNAATQQLEFAKLATEIEPLYWKHHFNLGLIQYMTGDVLAANLSNQQAVKLDPNELVYTNLGTTYFCLGEHQKAKDAYIESQKLAPDSYLGDEFLGMIYYFLGDFEQSALLRKRALNSFGDDNGGIHQMWGNLADSYRQLGEQTQAIEAYLTAISIVERDILRGNGAIADKIYRYYYYLMLTVLDQEHYPNDMLADKAGNIATFLQNELDASSYLRLAHIHYVQKNYADSQQALNKATQKCPGYLSNPDISGLQSAEFVSFQ